MSYNWSIWLLPKVQDKKIFSEYITFYSKLYASDSFPPHVTLFGRMNVNPKLFFSFINRVKPKSEIKNIQTLNMEIGDPPWKRLYIQLSLNKSLMDLQRKIKKKFKKYRDYEFDPHVSLAYGNFTPDKKDISLISYPNKISFCSLAFVNTPNEIRKWNLIQKFDFR